MDLQRVVLTFVMGTVNVSDSESFSFLDVETGSTVVQADVEPFSFAESAAVYVETSETSAFLNPTTVEVLNPFNFVQLYRG